MAVIWYGINIFNILKVDYRKMVLVCSHHKRAPATTSTVEDPILAPQPLKEIKGVSVPS